MDARLDLRVAEGRVAEVGASLDPAGMAVIDAGGLHLLPGLIDIHVHLREPGQEYKETVV